MKKLIFMLLFIGAFVMANSYTASAQFTVIPNDSSWSWTLLQINPTISGSKDGNIIPLSTNDIIVAQQNTVRITSDLSLYLIIWIIIASVYLPSALLPRPFSL
jgi:hypothetical protein